MRNDNQQSKPNGSSSVDAVFTEVFTEVFIEAFIERIGEIYYRLRDRNDMDEGSDFSELEADVFHLLDKIMHTQSPTLNSNEVRLIERYVEVYMS